MSGKMSVRERFSLEFVTATGAAAYSGAAREADSLDALPDFVLFEGLEDTPAQTAAAPEVSAALEAVEELKALFGAVRSSQ
ncbi:MAG: hypothetical protein K2W95_28360 [Candidatus Obscuribacterales bacterium]|nr:hypothetical protein [Candidatus Obscuribacterales bacterium]